MPGHEPPSTTPFWRSVHPAVRWMRYPLQIVLMLAIFVVIIWVGASFFD